jgi:hypothetical protein
MNRQVPLTLAKYEKAWLLDWRSFGTVYHLQVVHGPITIRKLPHRMGR